MNFGYPTLRCIKASDHRDLSLTLFANYRDVFSPIPEYGYYLTLHWHACSHAHD